MRPATALSLLAAVLAAGCTPETPPAQEAADTLAEAISHRLAETGAEYGIANLEPTVRVLGDGIANVLERLPGRAPAPCSHEDLAGLGAGAPPAESVAGLAAGLAGSAASAC